MPALVAVHPDLFHCLANDIQRTKFNPMPFEKFDLENLDKERRKAIAKSIRTISVEELKKLGGELFRYADDPWRETFFRFIAENSGATFHHAITSDGVNILYCRDQDKGMWFLPGSGMGPLQARGRQIMKEMIAGAR
jgi:hypothetical protein